MAPHLLHGTIHATIFEVDRLHSGWDFNACFKPTSQGRGKKFLSQVKRMILCSPEVNKYNSFDNQVKQISHQLFIIFIKKILGCRLENLRNGRLGKGKSCKNKNDRDRNNQPRWYESFHIYCAHNVSNIIFTVKDDNPVVQFLSAELTSRSRRSSTRTMSTGWLEILDGRS
uniref:Putative phospholipase D family n=1 Tax=Helianthus annuus TaxID=4232 RepID=A0A251ULD6_HELAN